VCDTQTERNYCVNMCVQHATGGRPGSVADIIAPKIRQSVKFIQWYSRRVKPYIKPLQTHPQAHSTCLCFMRNNNYTH